MTRMHTLKMRGIALVTTIALVMSLAAFAVSGITWPEKLQGFEKYNPVYTAFVEQGAGLDEMELPETLRGFASIPDTLDVSTFVQVQPQVDMSTGDAIYDYYNYGYVAPAGAAEKYAAGELVIYQLLYASGEVGYRLYGSVSGSVELWFICDADGDITGAVIDVPVVWSGTYNSQTPGTYTLTADISTEAHYSFDGQMPTAELVVSAPVVCTCGATDGDHSTDCPVYIEATAWTHADCDCGTDHDASVACTFTTTAVEVDEIAVDEIAVESDEVPVNLFSSAISYAASYASSAVAEEVEPWEVKIPTSFYNGSLYEYMKDYVKTENNPSRTWSTTVDGSWVDYLNTLWLNRMTGFAWTNTTGLTPWNGKGDDSSGFTNDEDAVYGQESWFDCDYTTMTYSVWYPAQLRSALLNAPSGATIEIMEDMDFNGDQYAWNCVNVSNSITINGNGHTMYNLGVYEDGTDTAGFICIDNGARLTVNNLDFATGVLIKTCYDETYKVEDSAYYGDNNMDANISLFVDSGGYFDFTDIDVDGFLVFSLGDCVSVLVDQYSVPNTDASSMSSCSNTITGCSISNSFVYGNDHISTFSVFGNDTAYSYSYAVNNNIVGYGYHSGAFVSCLANRATFDSCFAANNYMYSAVHVGGFVGFGGDAADYTNCYSTGKVEGFLYVGGFVASTYVGNESATGDFQLDYVRNFNTFTNCYSTALVGMRSETNTCGGFVGIVKYNDISTSEPRYYPKGSTLFTNCYAAGEVGNTDTDLDTNVNYAGGFVGQDQSFQIENIEGNMFSDTYTTIYTNCYYDKQTTAMGEWMEGKTEGDYYTSPISGPTSDTSTTLYNNFQYYSDVGLMGVLTTSTQKAGAGLTGDDWENWETNENYNSFTPGFQGFMNVNNDLITWLENEIVYDYNMTFYNYDTSYYSGVDEDGDPVGGEIANYFKPYASWGTTLNVKWDYQDELYPQLDVFSKDSANQWGDDANLVEAYSKASVSTVYLDTWDTGYDWTDGIRTLAEQSYDRPNDSDSDHVGDQYTYDTVRSIVTDATVTSSAAFDQIITNTTDNPIDISNYYDTLTVSEPGMDWYEISQTVNGVYGYRPIRLVALMEVYAGADATVENGATYDHRYGLSDETTDDVNLTIMNDLVDNIVLWTDDKTDWSSWSEQEYPSEEFYEAYTTKTKFAASEDAYVNMEVWVAEEAVDGKYTSQDGTTAYDEGLLVMLAEDKETPTTTTQQQWLGQIPLATDDLDQEQEYIVAYYWLLSDGRYRTDYKIITVKPIEDQYDIGIQVFDDYTTPTLNANVMNLDATRNTNYSLSSTTEYDAWDINIPEKTDVQVAWNQANPAYQVTRTELIFTNPAGEVIGETQVTGSLNVGDTYTIPVTMYYTMMDEDSYLHSSTAWNTSFDDAGETTSGVYETVWYTYQTTAETTFNVTYTVEEAADGTLYLVFDKTTPQTVERTVLVDDEVTTVPYVISFDDINCDILFNIYVQAVSKVDVTKKVVDEYGNDISDTVADAMAKQSFVIELGTDYDTQVALHHDETSNYIVKTEPAKISVSEIVPMEFDLKDITYSITNYSDDSEQTGTLELTDTLTISPGEVVHITVTNTYDDEAYFKDRAEVYNVFTAE